MIEPTNAALDAAEQATGNGPVVMVNLLWFRDTPDYPSDFAEAKPDSRTAYYEGYVPGFRAACEEVGVMPELLFIGKQFSGILADQNDDWEEIVVVRYASFVDLRKILNNETYNRTAKPHRLASIAKWRFIATREP